MVTHELHLLDLVGSNPTPATIMNKYVTHTRIYVSILFIGLSFLSFGKVSLATTYFSTTTQDNRVESSSPTTNYGTGTFLQQGSSPSGVVINRPLLNFTLPNLTGQTVSTVKLYLYQYSSALTTTIEAYKLTRTDWHETQSTWNIFKTANNWTTAGGDYSTLYGTSSVGTATQWYSWDLATSTLTFDGSTINILLKGTAETDANDDYHLFYSLNYTTNDDLRPYIEVIYATTTVASSTTYATSTPEGMALNFGFAIIITIFSAGATASILNHFSSKKS